MSDELLLFLYDEARALTEYEDGAMLRHFEQLRPEDVSERDFLVELIFVIYCSGFREQTLRGKWPAILVALDRLSDLRSLIATPEDRTRTQAKLCSVFANRCKAAAATSAIDMVHSEGWPAIRRAALAAGPHYFERFAMVGPVTCYHVARNIGLDVVKPDRHLVRIAAAFGLEPLELCERCGRARGHRIGAVDFTWWTWATLTPGYLARIVGEHRRDDASQAQAEADDQ